MGSFMVLGIDSMKKLTYFQCLKIGSARYFNVTKLNPCDHPPEIVHELFKALDEGFKYFSNDLTEKHEDYLTEILSRNDPRGEKPDKTKAKLEYIEGLIARGKFKVILREDVPPN